MGLSDSLIRVPNVLSGGARTYTQTVLGIAPANLIAYWPLSETSGTTADNAEGTAARDGTYTATVALANTPFDAKTSAPYFNGNVATYGNIYSASLNTAWSWTPITFAAWCKIGTDQWTDGTVRHVFNVWADSNNMIRIRKSNINNRVEVEYRGSVPSNTVKAISYDPSVSERAAWLHLVGTVSSGTLSFFVNGVSRGTPLATSAAAGALSATSTTIATFGISGANPFIGHIAHCAVWTTALTPTQIAALYAAARPT